MECSINKLSKMSGVSTRTLRYYDEIALLKPVRVASSGYRIYGKKEVDTLQQILFYKELGFSLDKIKKILTAPDFDMETAFNRHLVELLNQRERLDGLIDNVKKSMAAIKGEITMSDKEKFAAFAQRLVDENERKYGAEIRAKYGDRAVDASNAKVRGITKEQYEKAERLNTKFEETLKNAFATGDPAGELAQKACELHKQWLCIFYPNYSKEYHMGLGELYISDERFRTNYEKLAVGCTEFFHTAINVFCKE